MRNANRIMGASEQSALQSPLEMAKVPFNLITQRLNSFDDYGPIVLDSGYEWKLRVWGSLTQPKVQTVQLFCDKTDAHDWKVEANLKISLEGHEGGIEREISFQPGQNLQNIATFSGTVNQEEIRCTVTVLRITKKAAALIDFSRPNPAIFTDAVVQVKAHQFHVNKQFLCTFSNYFRRMFTGNLKVFVRGGVEPSEFFLLLGVLYHKQRVTRHTAFPILQACVFFEVDCLIADCFRNLRIEDLQDSSMMKCLFIADKRDRQDLLETITNQWTTIDDIPKNLVSELPNFKALSHISLRAKIDSLQKAGLQNPLVPKIEAPEMPLQNQSHQLNPDDVPMDQPIPQSLLNPQNLPVAHLNPPLYPQAPPHPFRTPKSEI